MGHAHYFIAAPLTDEAKTKISCWLKEKKAYLPFKTWVHPQDYHITLAFLGAVDTSVLTELQDKLTTLAAGYSPFILTADAVQTFGAKDRPRIFWIGTKDSEPLAALQKDVFQACIETDITLDSKPFKPHITIARRWIGNQPYAQNSDQKISIAWQVDKIVLYQTHMDRSPKYESLAEFYLGGDSN